MEFTLYIQQKVYQYRLLVLASVVNNDNNIFKDSLTGLPMSFPWPIPPSALLRVLKLVAATLFACYILFITADGLN